MAKKHALSTQLAKDAVSTIFKKPATQKYPFVAACVAENFRGKQVLDLEKCIGCGLCSRDCPAKAIEMVDVGGKKRPLIYMDRCVFCYQCYDSCHRNVFQTSKVFELAAIDKNTLVMRPPPLPVPVAPKPAPAPTAAPVASPEPAAVQPEKTPAAN
jgi:formate hydrogenlyase subunit 6/NADH:ubiquinone oxidoreductase subunit I